MGRFNKEVLDISGVDRRESGYYSTPKFIAEFLIESMLDLNPDGEYVLDPAVGKEELIEGFFLAGKKIDSFDLIDFGHHAHASHFYHQDFIEYFKQLKVNLIFNQQINAKYDYIISNPPYNCHEIDYIRKNKAQLKKLFPQVGALNMYSMFLAAMIDLAKEGALIGVILSDSFLSARLHSGLRQKILAKCSVHQLILCPNDLFRDQNADVRTVMMLLQKGKAYQESVKILNRPQNTKELVSKLKNKCFDHVELDSIVLSKEKGANQFIIGVPEEIVGMFRLPQLGDKFKCITGISTGNDKRYLSKTSTTGFEVPFFKNPGNRKFFTEPDAFIINHFMDESLLVKDFMVRNKNYVYKEGITCSSMGLPFSACYLPPNSTYGVNANIFLPRNDIYWMLAYLNSALVTYMVRGILIRSNMVTSGYVSQIPIPDFDVETKTKLGTISKNIIENKIRKGVDEKLGWINEIVFDALSISPKTREMILNFSNTLSTSV